MKNSITIKNFAAVTCTAAALVIGAAPSYAAGSHGGGHAEQPGHMQGGHGKNGENQPHKFDFGAPGEASGVTRTIDHDMMKMDMGGGKTMEHNDPNSALLEPGKSGEVIWKFTKAMELEFACNVPGHYEAGMVGKMNVK